MNTYELNNIKYSRGNFSLTIDSCAIEQGKIYSVVGPNGSGKSSLLNLLAFLQKPTSGNIKFNGNDVTQTSTAEILSIRRQTGYLLQSPYLFNMSVADNVAYGLKIRNLSRDQIKERTNSILNRFQIDHLAKRNAHTLSGGEAQRVALARTLVLDADVILLDEPAADVDHATVQMTEHLIKETCKEKNATVIMTTHSQDQAYRMSRNIISIINGAIHGIAYENVFERPCRRNSDGTSSASITDKLAFTISHAPNEGRVTIAIDPEDILLSEQKISSSALNTFAGTITRIDASEWGLRVFVDIGCILCIALTKKSLESMKLNIGSEVWTTFKASAIKIL